MKLLPDIRTNGHTISLQDPFVVDECLVTNISCYYEYRGRHIVFECGNYKVEFDMHELAVKARMVFSNYLNNSFSTVIYNDDNGWYSVDKQIFYNLNLFYNWLYDRLNTNTSISIGRLFDQERIYTAVDVKYLPEYDAVKLINYKKVDTNGRIIPSNVHYAEIESGGTMRCYNSSADYSNYYTSQFLSEASRVLSAHHMNHGAMNSNKTYIHQYDYTPEYIKHFMDHENKRTTLLLGVEIEVGGNKPEVDLNNKQSVVKKCIQIMNGSGSDDEDLIYSTHDSTVQIEIDTMPCSLEYHRNKMNYKEMFKYLDEQGYKGHDCDTAGLHIHANRDYLGKTKLQQELVISKILYIIEKFNDEICVIGRRHTDYSQFVGDRCKADTAINLFVKYDNTGKRAALNLQHKDTIEFRMFKSTLKYETFLLTLEFVKDIIDFAKSINIEEIEKITWNDLMKTFSKELQQYYVDRYNKILKKQLNEDINKRIVWLKKEIRRKKKYVKDKIGGQLGILNNNREISKLQVELKKCENEIDKAVAKNNIKKLSVTSAMAHINDTPVFRIDL